MSASREVGQRLRRNLGAIAELQPGEYCVLVDTEAPTPITTVAVRCPDCGGIDTLGGDYKVLPHSGLVTPRWKCETATCGFVQRLTLEAWEAS